MNSNDGKKNMNKQNTEQLKKEFKDRFCYGAYMETEAQSPEEYTNDIWNFFLPHLISSDEIKREDDTVLCGNAGENVYLTFKGGCREELNLKDSYRCTGCGGRFHKDCILKHFELEKDHDWGRKQERDKLLKEKEADLATQEGHKIANALRKIKI